MDLKLYTYWRSSAAYRVRIALNLKGVAYESIPVSLAPAVLAHRESAYRAVNPQMRLPSLDVDGDVLIQSMAILEWIEESFPEPALLPADPILRAQARAFAQLIVSDIHPLQNSSILGILRNEYEVSDAGVRRWVHGAMQRGFEALEALAANLPADPFLFGGHPGLAEICLVPQLYNARRFDVDLSPYPRLLAVDGAVSELGAFKAAHPDMQPDAP
ncbi:MAG: maleylacetoacetate isomerase [Hyphomonadaceae bacterium]|nr:maleylacetoacetate isomerase [Hyphomonadaceae bacterium]